MAWCPTGQRIRRTAPTGGIGARLRPVWVVDLHRFLAALTVAFTGVHVVAILADTYVNFDVARVLVPFSSNWSVRGARTEPPGPDRSAPAPLRQRSYGLRPRIIPQVVDHRHPCRYGRSMSLPPNCRSAPGGAR